MIPSLQKCRLEIEGDGEQRDDDVRQGEVSDEVIGHRLKGKASLRQMSKVFLGQTKVKRNLIIFQS